MTESPHETPAAAPRVVILLPVAVALHIAEEWHWGLVDWAVFALNLNIGTERFLAINAVGLVLIVIGSILAYREPSAAWIGVSIAALVGANAIAHTVLSLAVGSYSPGTITGLFLYLPLVFIIMRWAAANLSRGVIGAAILFGIGIHAVATLSATL